MEESPLLGFGDGGWKEVDGDLKYTEGKSESRLWVVVLRSWLFLSVPGLSLKALAQPWEALRQPPGSRVMRVALLKWLGKPVELGFVRK